MNSKIIPRRAKKGIRENSLISENGVITPSWQMLGIKNDPSYSEQSLALLNYATLH